MKWIMNEKIRMLLLGLVLPAAILSGVLFLPARAPSQETLPSQNSASGSTHTQTQTQGTVSATDPTFPTTSQPSTEPMPPMEHMILVRTGEQTVQMPLESYVLGVVLAEVPASFDPETLKAQAVAARTYGLQVCESGRHNGAICTNYGCCQAYRSEEAYMLQGGNPDDLEKIRAAVMDTQYQVLTYEGALICATYFSCSGGSTEDAVAVWGSDVAYLQAVESPGEEFASVYSGHYVFTEEEFEAALCFDLSGSPSEWFGQVCYTRGGGVDTIYIDGIDYRGTTLRALLGLRSTAFTITVRDEMIHIVTRGYGHRVGMSQYGAEAMALNGADYQQILLHYYQGTTLRVYGE